MADENSFVQEIKFKVDDSELRAAVDFMKKELGVLNVSLGKKLPDDMKKVGKEASKTAKETEKIAKASKNAVKETDKLGNSFGKVTSAIKGAVAAYAGLKGISALVGFGKGSLAAYSAQKRSELMLDTVLRNRGMGFASGYIKNAASELQQRTTIGDESMIAGAAELATYIKDPKQLKRMMGLLADYSMGMTGGAELSPEAVTNLATGLGKAFDGTYEAMRKKGFDTSELEMISNALKLKEDLEKGNVARDKKTGELKLSNDDKELLKWLRENRGKNIEDLKITALENAMKDWKGLADEFANTDEGKIQQLKNTIGDMREDIGKMLLPVVGKLAQNIKANLPALNKMFVALGKTLGSLVNVLSQNFDKIVAVADVLAKGLELFAEYPVAITAFAGSLKILVPIMNDVRGSAFGVSAAFSGVGGVLTNLVKGGLITAAIWGLTQIFKAISVGIDLLKEKGNEMKRGRWQGMMDNAVNAKITAQRELKEFRAQLETETDPSKREVLRGKIMNREMKIADANVQISNLQRQAGAGGHGFSVPEPTKGPEAKAFDFDFEKQYADAMAAIEKSAKGSTTINNINYTNNITTDSDLMAKAIKENLRTLLTSQLTFVSRSETARALAL